MKISKAELFVAISSFSLYLILSGMLKLPEEFAKVFDPLKPAMNIFLLTSVALWLKPLLSGVWELFHWWMDKQVLKVLFVLPAKLNPKIAAVLLNGDDAQIYFYLVKHGRTKQTEEGLLVKYRGEHIYDHLNKTFHINGAELKPETIKVLNVK